MSSPVNGVSSYDHGYVHYSPSGEPISTGSHMLYDQSVQSNHRQWDNNSPPPSYDSLDRLPTGSEEISNFNTPPASHIGIKRTQKNFPSTSQVSNMPPSVQQAPRLMCISPSTSPEPNGLSTLLHQVSYTAGPQTIDFKQRLRRFRPRILGIALLIVSMLEIILGISLALSIYNHEIKSLSYGSLFWVPGFNILAGGMWIVSWAKTSLCSVQWAVSISFLSLFASVVGITFNSCDLSELHDRSGSRLSDRPDWEFTDEDFFSSKDRRWKLNDHKFFSSKDRPDWEFKDHQFFSLKEKEIYIFYCLIALNVLALLLSLGALCIGNALGLKRRSQQPHVITLMPR